MKSSATPITRRRWPTWALLLALAVPVLEVVVLIAIGKAIGFWPTVLALVLIAALGGYLIKREGPRTWRSLRAAATGVTVDGVAVRATPAVPTRELSDASLVLIGAILLLLPGFLTDVLGILCLLPFTRPLVRGLLSGLIRRRYETVAARVRGQVRAPVPTSTIGDDRDGPAVSPNRIIKS